MLGDEEMHRFWGDLQTKLAVMLRIRGRMHLCRGDVHAAEEALAESLERDPTLQAAFMYGLAQLGPVAPPIARGLRNIFGEA
jgi:hypothetical protein